ncbi:MAG TPA: surface carbohydrate biosynthesis protein [Burkholderiales bacterium]|nr:surface carbohydrate biosynthesis protein [Burkholderiales bacterium]
MAGNRRPLAALIVDNPLRDLDGLVLLAATLVGKGIDAVLVPMYEQGFDVPALRPDVVVANYVRDNNRDLLAAYRGLGSRIVILDSEGAAGRTAEAYARMVANAKPAEVVDDYCVWGRARHGALLASGALPEERVHLTGCPRYDFCAEPWSAALPAPSAPTGFILVNTNFPLPNPRFAASVEEERRTLQRVWNDPGYVAAVNRDARTAFEGMLRAIERLARRFPDRAVVVRPHPFEAVAPYEALESPGNLSVRQEGTSLEWIRAAAMLVHQNCTTAVEAVMLGREPISLEWLSTEALRLPGPSAVSVAARSEEELERMVAEVLAGRSPAPTPECARARSETVEELFFANDGRSSQRAAEVIARCLSRERTSTANPRRRVRSVGVDFARRLLGYEASNFLRRSARGKRDGARRAAKAYSAGAVSAILRRISAAAPGLAECVAAPVPGSLVASPRLASGQAVYIGRES